MSKTKKAKQMLIFRLAIIAFSAYVLISFITVQLDVSKQKKELAAIQLQIKEEKYVKEEFEELINSGVSKEYIMKIAREKLGYVFPDEKIFVEINGNQ